MTDCSLLYGGGRAAALVVDEPEMKTRGDV